MKKKHNQSLQPTAFVAVAPSASAEFKRYVARKYICSIGVLKIQFQWQMV